MNPEGTPIPRPGWAAEAIVRWLFSEGRRISDPSTFVEALCRTLVEEGAPLWRIRFGCQTIHPLIAAWSVVWATDSAHAEERMARHGYQALDTYRGSPIEHVLETGTPFRRRLMDLERDRDHRLLFELAEEGGTDYFAVPFRFSDDKTGNLVLTSDHPDGFSDADIEKFTALVDYLVPLIEVFATRRVAGALADTYMGKRTGERVLSGQIKRGDGEEIHAAIWFSDLRHFTHLTETLPGAELIDLLNSYFEAVTVAVTARGGEVLRFIGDAMLIVFPVTESTGLSAACEAALDAAEDAFQALATLNRRRRETDAPEIAFGVGLHVGEVLYGNVGAPDRLDFTVMGPAVNRTARLESLTKTVGRRLLLSRAFADAIARETVSHGHHAMKGVPEPQEVFSLAAE